MIRKLLLQSLFSFITFYSFSQNCNCKADFIYIQQEIEKKHPGFKYNIQTSGKQNYDILVANVIKKIDQNANISRENCAAYIAEYLTFIKDKHLSIKANEGIDKVEANLSKDMSIQVLDSETRYIKLPAFFKTYWQEIDAFYDTIIPKLAERPYLIIDLRNNTGGGERQYNQLLQFLKQQKNNPDKIALIYNRYCASTYEQFVMKMKKSKKVITFGENSYGAFAYGHVMRKYTPNCQLRFQIPTKKYNKYLPYEYSGIPPDVPFAEKSDWIEQAKTHLKKP